MLNALSPQRRRLAVVCAALAVLAVLGVGAAVLVRSLGSEPVDQGRPGPVLLVAGYGGRVASLDPLVQSLRALGRTTIVVQPVGGNTGDLQLEAEHLGRVVEQVQRDTGAPSVDVVGYSAGGVIARLWVKEYGGAASARRVLTLGSPHHGTSQATLGLELAGGCAAACEQLVPTSDLLRRLNAGDETPDGPLWATVRTNVDQVVTPVDSAALVGALNVIIQERCPGSTAAHGDLPADPVVEEALSTVLGAGYPSVPRSVRC
jgi:triacylglycerol lipase